MSGDRALHDLRWFYSEAEGDLGLRGQSLEPGLGGDSDPHERASRRLEDASRWSDVASRLRAIGTRHERVLRLAYTPHRWVGLDDWFELAGVAAYLVAEERDQRTAPSLPRAVADLRTLEWFAHQVDRLTLHDVSLDWEMTAELQRRRERVDSLRRATVENVLDVGRRIPHRTDAQRTELKDRARHVLGLALTAYRGAYRVR